MLAANMKYRTVALIIIGVYLILWGPFLATIHFFEDYGLNADSDTYVGNTIRVTCYPHYMVMAYSKCYYDYSIWFYNVTGKSKVWIDWEMWRSHF